MNILVLSHEYPPIGGGGANACMYLTKEYIKRDCKVVIITTGFGHFLPKTELYDGKLIIYRLNAKRKYVDHCSFVEMFDYMLKAIQLANKIVKRECFDICQVFFGIPSGPIGWYLLKKYNIPYVIRLGGGDVPGFQERFKLIYKLVGIPLKIIWKDAKAIVANSEGLRKFAQDFYDKCHINVIHNGIDTEVFCPSDYVEDENQTKILFVSRLIKRKGLQNLIPYIDYIEKESLRRVLLTVVGDGPFREELEELTQKNNLQSKVVFEGQKDKDELLWYYQNSDVFVFPSYREGMPNVVLEAMGCGLPIIMMNDCEGAKELVTENGILAIDNISQGIISFLKCSKKERKYMGIVSRNRAEKEYSWNSIAEEYLLLFNSVIEK